MSIKIMSEVWEHAPVDQGTLLVLLALADSADEYSRSCYPGIDGLAAKSRLSERQVQYCLQRLREVGVISVRRNASPAKTNLYTITKVDDWAKVRDAIIAPHGTKAETQSATARDATDCVIDTQLVAPKPSVTEEEPSVVRARGQESLFSAKGATPQLVLTPPEPAEGKHPPAPLTKPAAFERFWAAFPKKAGKEAARRAWDKAITRADPERIIDGARRYAASDQVMRGFVKHPQGWLNDGRWDDADLWPSQVSSEPWRGTVVR